MSPLKKVCAGRPKGEYTEMNEDEKHAYHHNAVKKHRGADTLTASPLPDGQTEPTSSGRPRGRPPLNEAPMTLNTLKKRNKDNLAESRKRKKLLDVRRNSIMSRWRKGADEVNVEVGEEDDNEQGIRRQW